MPAEEESNRQWTVFKAIGSGCDIIAFSLVGYIIGDVYGMSYWGAAVGTIVGTVFMWVHLLLLSRRIERYSELKKYLDVDEPIDLEEEKYLELQLKSQENPENTRETETEAAAEQR